MVVASTIGNAFEWFDFLAFGFFLLVIVRELFPGGAHAAPLLLGTATFGIAFIFRPIGGVVFGMYADRVGRKKAVALMVLLMALATACLGLIPPYAAIGLAAPLLAVAARMLQGFSAGGEFSGATALLIEYAPPGRRGYYGSFQMCSQALAITLAALAAYALSAALSASALHAWGWRIPFLFGVLVGPVGFYIRRRLQESPEFAAFRQRRPASGVAQFTTGLLDARGAILTGFGLTIAATISAYVTVIYMPIFVVERLHLSLTQATFPTMLCGLLLVLLCPLAGHLSDRWGRKRMLLTAISAYALVMLVLTGWMLHAPGFGSYLLLQFAASLCLAFLWGPYPTAVTETVPVGVRATGVALLYNFGVMLFGGLAPFFITALIKLTGDAMAPAFYAAGGMLLAILSYGIWGRDASRRSDLSDTPRTASA